jgi:hypothetical protein
MNNSKDRLYNLLPVVYRQRDAERGYPLRALLEVIAEQVDIVERDMANLYDNWFIETCQDWVTPYIGELIGYSAVQEAGTPGDIETPQGRERNKILVPRREVANTIRNRRRKGALALLELMASDVAGWPSRAIEFYKLLAVAQNINRLHLTRGRSVDLRNGNALDLLNCPFDELAHTVDLRRITSHRTTGLHNIPSVGLFVWRLRPYSVTNAPAYCYQEGGPHRYTFSVLGNDTQLYTRPVREADPSDIASELNLPAPIRRRALERNLCDYYGDGKSIEIWIDKKVWEDANEHPDSDYVGRWRVPPERIIVSDLTGWIYEPPWDKVALDPVLGRIAFHPAQIAELDEPSLWVSYLYGFSADIAGGEYKRRLREPHECRFTQPREPQETNHDNEEEKCIIYRVGRKEKLKRVSDAIDEWKRRNPPFSIIEITDSEDYVEKLNVQLAVRQSLQLRAAGGKRPVVRLLDYHTTRPDYLRVTGETGSRFMLDGLLVTGRGIYVRGELDSVTIRHSTLVPGWAIGQDSEPVNPTKPSLELFNTRARINVEQSIIGSVQVTEDEVREDPIHIFVSDSVLDSTGVEEEAMGGPGNRYAHAILTIVRSTVIGYVQVHAIELGENSIFDGVIKVARRQLGCLRFCYVTPGSRTPRRYNCQPDLVEKAVLEQFEQDQLTPGEKESALERERLRVRPLFDSTRYGTPVYCRLAKDCAEEIRRGADDESEMGVFHDLYQPQRERNLLARLREFTPAGMEAGIIYAS